MKAILYIVTISFFFTTLNTFSCPITIGLNADMSSGSQQAGEAIQRGLLIAINEINKNGGLLNCQVSLQVRDHQGNPSRGKSNIKKFDADSKVVAVFGGLHTPVILAEKKVLFDTEKVNIPYLVPWAAGTPVVFNRWIFRLSVRDEYAGPFLVNKALTRNYKKIALLLEQTPWGRSNEKSMKAALAAMDIKPTIVEWFPWKVDSNRMAQKLEKVYQSGAQVLLLVANAPEGATVLKKMAQRNKEKRLPLISHWGITGGDFPARVGSKVLNQVDLSFLQTYSFLTPQSDKGKNVIKQAIQLFPNIKSARDLTSPVGTAHSYDLMHLLAQAINQANSQNREKVRDALESLPTMSGLVRSYSPPFNQYKEGGKSHDALDVSDFNLSQYQYNKTEARWLIKHVN